MFTLPRLLQQLVILFEMQLILELLLNSIEVGFTAGTDGKVTHTRTGASSSSATTTAATDTANVGMQRGRG